MANESRLLEPEGERSRRLLGNFMIFYREATGRIMFDDGELEATFILYQLNNGTIVIEAVTDWDINILIGNRTIRQTSSITEREYILEGYTDSGLFLA